METKTHTRLVALLGQNASGNDGGTGVKMINGVNDEESAEKWRVSELQWCVESVNELGRSPTTSKRALRELQVLCAEACVEFGDVVGAAKLIQAFQLQSSACDQFYCRSMFVQARLEERKAAALQGQAAVSKTLGAVKCLMNVVELYQEITNRPKYDFLVFNASVLLWQVVRPLQRYGLRAHAADALGKAVAALTATNDHNLVWRGRLSIALAQALEEKGELSAAQSECKSALALFQQRLNIIEAGYNEDHENNKSFGTDKIEILQVIERAERLAIHLGQVNSISVAKTSLVNGDISGLLQCVRSGILPDIKDLEEASKVLGIQNKASATPKMGYLRSVVAVGKLALRKQAFELSTQCLERAFDAKGSRTTLDDIELNLFRAEWLAECPESSFDLFNGKSDGVDDVTKFKAGSGTLREQKKKLAAIELAKRIEAIKSIERAILSCMRLNAPDILEECCVTVWNVGLPLLQPQLKQHVHKAFLTAATALEEIDSPMVQLRAHFHTEIAKCEAAAEFLTKASAQADKALKLDFGAGQHGAENCGANSDLKKFLIPLRHKLKLKSNIYSDPGNNFEQALLQVEQAKDACDRQLKVTLLSRAASLLLKPEQDDLDTNSCNISSSTIVPAVALPETDSEEDGTLEQARLEEARTWQKDSLMLWGDIAKLAWAEKHLDITGQAGAMVLELSVPLIVSSSSEEGGKPAMDDRNIKEIRRLCAEINFIYAEIFAERIERMTVHEETPLVANLNVKALGLRTPVLIPFYEVEQSAQAEQEEEEEEEEEGVVSNNGKRNIVAVDKLDKLVWDFEETAFDERLSEYKQGIIDSILGALRIGLSLKEDWLVENAVTYLWNYHLHVFNGPLQRFEFVMPSLVAALVEARTALSAVQELNELNAALFAGVCCTLAQCLEALARDEGTQADLSPTEEAAFGGRVPAQLLAKAVEECQVGIAYGGDLENVKELYSTLHRIQRVRGNKNEDLPADNPLAAGFCVVELLRLPKDLVEVDEKNNLLTKTVANLEANNDQVLPKDKKNNLLGLELWTRLGREAFDFGDEHTAELCAITVTAQLSDSVETHSSQWRWFALAECLLGRIQAARGDRVTCDKVAQDALRESALKYLCLAAEYGVRAGTSRVVLDVGRELWKLAAPLLGSVATRNMLFKPVQVILNALTATKETSDMQLRMLLYTAVIECFKDVEDWKGGLVMVDSAFKIIPQKFQKSLWEARVIFSSKLGKDVAAGLHKMKEGTPSLQAKAWITFARSSASINGQMKSYLSALELLKASFERGDVLIEFAEWLHANHFERDQVTQCLLAAADLILDVQAAEEKATAKAATAVVEIAISPGNGNSVSTIKRAGSPISTASRMSCATHRTITSAGIGSIGGRNKVNTNVVSSSGAAREIGDPMPDAPRKLNLGLMLRLVQIFTMLGRSVSHNRIRSDMALVAHDHLSTAWKRFVLKSQDEDKPLELIQVLSAARDSELLESATFKQQFATIERVSLVKHYLLELGNLLQESGHHLISSSSFAMIELLCTASGNRSFGVLAKLKSLRCMCATNQSHLARKELESLDLELDEKERQFYAIEVEQILAQRKAATILSADGGSAEGVAAVSLQTIPRKAESTRIDGKKFQKPIKRKLLHRLKIREVWVLTAEEMIALGYVFHAKQLLQEVALHNEAYDDEGNSVRYHVCCTRVMLLEGKQKQALEHIMAGMNALRACSGGNVLEWLRIFQILAECLHTLDRGFEVQAVLRKAMTAFEDKVRQQGSIKDLDLEVAASYLEMLLAKEVLADAQHRAAGGGEWQPQFRSFQTHARNAQDRVLIATKPNCACIAAVDLLVKHCAMWKSVFDSGVMRMQDTAFINIVDGLARASRCAETVLQMVLPANQAFLGAGVGAGKEDNCSLPIERFVGHIQLLLGSVELEYASRLAPPITAQKRQALLARDASLDPVETWLKSTASPRQLAVQEIEPGAATRACTRLVSAYALLQAVPALSMRALLAAGKGLARVSIAADVASATDALAAKARAEAAAQACELLERAASEAVAQRVFAVAGEASFELVQLACHLEGDNRSGSRRTLHHLLRYQSERAREWMQGVLTRVACDKRGKLACFFRMKDSIEAELVNPTLGVAASSNSSDSEDKSKEWCTPIPDGWPYNGCKAFLQRIVPMQRLDCSRCMDDIIRAVPSTASFLVMSFPPNSRTLYVCLFSKQTYSDDCVEVRQVHLSEEETDKLHSLSGFVVSFRKRLASHILDHDNDPTYGFNRCETADSLNDEFKSACEGLKQLLGPTVTPLFLPASKISTQSQGEKEGNKQDQYKQDDEHEGGFVHAGVGRNLVIFADENLSRLPLEVLVEDGAFKSVSRDFSAHFFAHRVAELAPNVAPESLAAISSGEQVEPIFQPRPVKVRAVVDPLNEECALSQTFDGVKKAEWEGHFGDEHGVPSASTWQQTMVASAEPFQFLFLGLAPMLSYIKASALSALDMRKCTTAVLLDRAYNDVALRNANKRDSLVKATELELQQPLESVALLSMCGVNTVIVNQWSNSIKINSELLELCLVQALAAPQKPLSQALNEWASAAEEEKEKASNKAGEGAELKETEYESEKADESTSKFVAAQTRLKLRVKLNTVAWGLPV